MSTACGGVIAGCGADPTDDTAPTATAQQALIGDALPGITAADFAAAKDAFATVEGIDDGLGPIFNERGCGNCHTQGAIGGAGVQIERRFGAVVSGIFHDLASEGGSLRQLQTLGTFT
ncbi:MAG TPA: hypothetical protein VFT22_08305, partial [Kofleriaceae bacterium]|nr:hypothetical protein [Kofleriaceae bacterium]